MPFLPTWTDENIQLLTDLWLQGVPGGQIADRLGMTRNMVIGKANRMGLARKGETYKEMVREIHGENLLLPKRQAFNAKSKKKRPEPSKPEPVEKIVKPVIEPVVLAPPPKPAPVVPSKPVSNVIPLPIAYAPPTPPVPRTEGEVRIIDLGIHECRYPLGKLFDAPRFFCAEPSVPGKSYCDAHCKKVFRQGDYVPAKYSHKPTRRISSN
jgi:GcrA cell cycle regulator